MKNKKFFVEVDYSQYYKHDQIVGGDVFYSQKNKFDNRIISVLSDGLGSGIKAGVLATLTSTMALRFVHNMFDIKQTAKVIMKTLPVCKVRKISYSTFTIADINYNEGKVRIIEYDNPPFFLIRNNKIVDLEKKLIEVKMTKQKINNIYFSEFDVELGDRIVMCSDGVNQSGLGTNLYPLGWGDENVADYSLNLIKKQPDISARMLSKKIVDMALLNDCSRSHDDITCGVIYFREPRKSIVVTGPPIFKEKDKKMADIVESFKGKKIVCGGTTGNIIARELNKTVEVDLSNLDPKIPPSSKMEGIDLVTEGILTLCEVSEILEKELENEIVKKNAAYELVDLLLDSDIINFLVGTKINEVHQDPNMPIELDIRRNIIKKIIKLLEEKHLKETTLTFI